MGGGGGAFSAPNSTAHSRCEVTDARHILIASGKVGHELRAERRLRKDTSKTAIFLPRQLYPLPRRKSPPR